MAYPLHRPDAEVPASPDLPALEIPEGANVRVVRIDGATAVVEPLT